MDQRTNVLYASDKYRAMAMLVMQASSQQQKQPLNEGLVVLRELSSK